MMTTFQIWENILCFNLSFIVKFHELLFLNPNSNKVGAITPKINTKFPFVVWNLVIKFLKDLATCTQAIIQKPSVYRQGQDLTNIRKIVDISKWRIISA